MWTSSNEKGFCGWFLFVIRETILKLTGLEISNIKKHQWKIYVGLVLSQLTLKPQTREFLIVTITRMSIHPPKWLIKLFNQQKTSQHSPETCPFTLKLVFDTVQQNWSTVTRCYKTPVQEPSQTLCRLHSLHWTVSGVLRSLLGETLCHKRIK